MKYTVTLYYTLTQEFYGIEAEDEEAAEEAVKALIETGHAPDQESTAKRPDDIIVEEEDATE